MTSQPSGPAVPVVYGGRSLLRRRGDRCLLLCGEHYPQLLPRRPMLMGSTPFTLEMWVQQLAIGDLPCVPLGSSALPQKGPTGTPPRAGSASTDDGLRLPPRLFDDGRWHHIAITSDGSAARVWHDGALHGSLQPAEMIWSSIEVGSSLIIDANADRAIGLTYCIDDVRLSDVVRYAAAFAPRRLPNEADDNTVGLWTFDTF